MKGVYLGAVSTCLAVGLLSAELAGSADATVQQNAAPVVASAPDAVTRPVAVSAVAVAATPAIKNLSGMRWASGVFLPNTSPKAHKAFAKFRGRPTDVAMIYIGRQNWAQVSDPSWAWQEWKAQPQTLVLSAAPFPDPTKKHKYSLKACAQGKYNKYWQNFGAQATANGMASRTIVRLGWEMNGNWTPWSAYKPADYIGCWRKIYKSAESKAPGLRWDWTVNRGHSQSLKNPKAAFPGKPYVDYIGIDSYDGYPPVKSAAGWRTQYAGVGGLKYWSAFAKKEGKKFSVAEWGLYPGTAWKGHGGGDNKYYITKMFGFFRSLGKTMGYESYFNDPSKQQAGALKLNPKGAKEYKRQLKLSLKKK